MDLIEQTRAQLGPVGVWLPSAPLAPPADVELRAARRIEELGYSSVWSGEGVGSREAFAHNGNLLASTGRITLGAGIANLWSRPARTMQAGGATLAAAHPGRFVLGVGIGHAFQAAKAGSEYRPVDQTRAYLSTMDEAAAEFPPPVAFPRVLAAVGPRMLELSAELADGAHPFAQPFEHTPYAREILGPDKLLIPEQSVLLGTREQARANHRRTIEMMRQLGIPHYMSGWKRLGYTDSDIDEVSDRLVDSLTAWGDEEAIVRRVRDLLDAGADHVLVSPIGDSLESIVEQLERLAPALTEMTR
jgi:probable F420-dependent oxidoreductase